MPDDVSNWQILLKKSALTSDEIFAAALVRPSESYVGDLVIKPPSNERLL
jgi:hypothetical protein